jgi:putative Ca2+/H+ antiporter (TMEM165/GDT1 family)
MTDLLACLTSTVTSYLLIFAAEIGDKSQLVCMVLATRHRAMPVIWGAIVAFAFLNALAVIFGMAIANWLPEFYVSLTVAILFAIFGIQALRIEEDEGSNKIEKKITIIFSLQHCCL